MEDNCFTILCWLLPYSSVNQPHVHILPPSWTSLPTPHLIPPLSVVTGYHAELLVLYSNFPLVIYFTYGNICFNTTLSVCPPSRSPDRSKVCFLCPSLHCCPANRFISISSRLRIYVLIYDICFSLSDLLPSVRQPLGPSTSLQMTVSHLLQHYLLIQ